jgi:hypothetical protein
MRRLSYHQRRPRLLPHPRRHRTRKGHVMTIGEVGGSLFLLVSLIGVGFAFLAAMLGNRPY